jgi:hypothetical protein
MNVSADLVRLRQQVLVHSVGFQFPRLAVVVLDAVSALASVKTQNVVRAQPDRVKNTIILLRNK